MSSSESTPSAILRELSQTGIIPESMLPLKPFQNTPEDPSKPLRGAFEGILFARVAPTTLLLHSQEMSRQQGREFYTWNMLSVAEIDEEESLDIRLELLQRKRAYLMKHFQAALKQGMISELRKCNR